MIRLIDTREQLEKVVREAAGFVYNDFRGRDPKMCPVHAASCSWLAGMLKVAPGRLSVKKVWSDSLPELLAWIAGHDRVYRLCGSEPGLADSGHGKAAATAPPAPPTSRATIRHAPSLPTQTDPSDFSGLFHASKSDSPAGPAEFWSRNRLQFDSKPITQAMKRRIRDLVATLEAGDQGILRAIYTSSSRDIVDAENVLFYNVGTGAFARAARFGVRFERSFNTCSECPDCPDAIHHHRYDVCTPAAPFIGWKAESTLVSWEGVESPPIDEFTKPHGIWLAMKRASLLVSVRSAPLTYGLRVRVSRGARGSRNAAAIVKPLIDGVVAALHTHDGSDLGVVASRVAREIDEDDTKIAELLMSEDQLVLGRRRLLWPRAAGVQWNPGDDACVAAEILVSDSTGNVWSHSGELFAVVGVA